MTIPTSSFGVEDNDDYASWLDVVSVRSSLFESPMVADAAQQRQFSSPSPLHYTQNLQQHSHQHHQQHQMLDRETSTIAQTRKVKEGSVSSASSNSDSSLAGDESGTATPREETEVYISVDDLLDGRFDDANSTGDSFDPLSPPSSLPLAVPNKAALVRKYLMTESTNSHNLGVDQQQGMASLSSLYDFNNNPVNAKIKSVLSGNWHITVVGGHINGIIPESSSLGTKQLTFHRRNMFSVTSKIELDALPTTVRGADGVNVPIESLSVGLDLFSKSKSRKWQKTSVISPSSAPSSSSFPSESTLSSQNQDPSDSKPVPTLLTKEKQSPALQRFDLTPQQSPLSALCRRFEWSKLRFSSATVNNGAPNFQPYYQVNVNLYANTTRGDRVLICRSISRAIVVRGRHPDFYKDRFSYSLSSDKRLPNTTSKRKSVSGKPGANASNKRRKSSASSDLPKSKGKKGKDQQQRVPVKVEDDLSEHSVSRQTQQQQQQQQLQQLQQQQQLYLMSNKSPRSDENAYKYYHLEKLVIDDLVEGFYNPHFVHQASTFLKGTQRTHDYYCMHDSVKSSV